MTRRSALMLLMLVVTLSPRPIRAEEMERRIVRLESRIYGWYAVAEPAFDKTLGRRQLYKVSGNDQFLKGLAGRLVLLEGVFSDGSLHLPVFARPPVSLSDGAQRRVLSVSRSHQSELLSESGFQLRDPQGLLANLETGRWKLDLVVEPGNAPSIYHVAEVISSLAQEETLNPNLQGSIDQPALLDITLTQDFLDVLTRLGLQQANLTTTYQGLTLSLTNLYLKLPQTGGQDPWSLQGSVEIRFGSTTSLAETSFLVDAEPLVQDNFLYLRPDWQNIQVEGQLPFAFALGTKHLGIYAQYLPEKVSIIDLNLVTRGLRSQELLPKESEPVWFLGSPVPQSVRLALGNPEQPLPEHESLLPGSFRLILGQQVVDRLVQREIGRIFSPNEPYIPQPPIEVGKALFIPILVKEIYIRNLGAGYNQSVFRFQDLTIDVGWVAGPLSGLEPLLRTSGFIRPKLSRAGDKMFWDWDLIIEDLEVRSDKLPGNRSQLAREFRPQIEASLGAKLAREKMFSNKLSLSTFLGQTEAQLEFTRMRALDASLTLEGRINP